MTDYRMHVQVLSGHCDSSGIVHFPRMLDIAHQVVENWFDEALDWPFAQMQGGARASIPVVQARTRFPAATRLGDHLLWRLDVQRIGRTSMELGLTGQCGADIRAEIALTVVLSDLGVLRARHWPDMVRARAADYLSPDTEAV